MKFKEQVFLVVFLVSDLFSLDFKIFPTALILRLDVHTFWQRQLPFESIAVDVLSFIMTVEHFTSSLATSLTVVLTPMDVTPLALLSIFGNCCCCCCWCCCIRLESRQMANRWQYAICRVRSFKLWLIKSITHRCCDFSMAIKIVNVTCCPCCCRCCCLAGCSFGNWC